MINKVLIQPNDFGWKTYTVSTINEIHLNLMNKEFNADLKRLRANIQNTIQGKLNCVARAEKKGYPIESNQHLCPW